MPATRYQGANSSILPIDVNELLVKPVTTESTAFQVFKTIPTSAAELQLPAVESDPTVGFVDEAAQYGFSDVTLSTQTVRPRKIGAVIGVSNEYNSDSNPAYMDLAGEGLVRSITRAVDAYTFGNQGATSAAFAGIRNQAAYGTLPSVTWDGTTSTDFVDTIIDSQTRIEGFGYLASAIVMNSADVNLLAKDRAIEPDPHLPQTRTIQGIAISVCDAVPAGTAYVVDPNSAAIVLRDNAQVSIDASVGFTSDLLYVKASIRCAFAVLDKNGLVQIKTAA